MPFNPTGLNATLSGGLGNLISHVGLQTLVDPTTTLTAVGEATGGAPAYARLAVAWAAPAAGARSNSGALAFNAPAGSYGFVSFWNALTGNAGTQYLGYAHLNNTRRGFFTCDATDVTANTITSAAHGLANTNRVMVYNVFAEALPAGMTEGTIYFVVGATTDTFQLSLTSGGAAVDITGIGEGVFFDLVPETFAVDGTLSIAIGALVLDAVVVS
jgi:hypothetical protein